MAKRFFLRKAHKTAKLRQSLKLWQVVMIGLAYITPMTVFDTFGIVSKLSEGHVPAAYILALAGVLFTAFSYVQLIKAFPTAGSAYTYAQKAISPAVGFLVGWSSLLCYILLPMHCALLTKIYMHALFPAVPEWLWVALFVAIVTLINTRSINLAANFSTLFVLIQFAIIAASVVLIIHGLQRGEGKGTLLSLDPILFDPKQLLPIISGATVLCFSFIGFDAVTTLSEETPNATKTIPRSIYLVVIYGGLIFISVSFFVQLYFPDISRFKDHEAALPEIALYIGGAFFQVLFLASTFINTLAGGLASQASVSRVLFAMGRDDVFPKKYFGYIHPQWHTPAFNVVLVGIIAMSALFFDLETGYALVNYGALVAFTFVNISVIMHFYVKNKRRKMGKETICYLIMPLIGAATVGVLWLNLEADALITGLTWSALGLFYLMLLTRRFSRPIPQYQESAS